VGGFSTDSLASTTEATEEDLQLAPKLVDINRLVKLKAEQEKKLQSVSQRVEKFKADEQKVWKDMGKQQNRSLQQQESQWRRQSQQAEKLRQRREQDAYEQALRDRAHFARERARHAKEQRKLQNFEVNQRQGDKVRQESTRLMHALSQVRDQTRQNKLSQVEQRKLTLQKAKLMKEDGSYRQDHCRKDVNERRYTELQEEIQQASIAIAAAERDEMCAIFQLQNSRQYRDQAQALFQLKDVEQVPQASSPSSNSHSPRVVQQQLCPGGENSSTSVLVSSDMRLQCSTARIAASDGASASGLGGTPSSSRHGSLGQICEDKPVP